MFHLIENRKHQIFIASRQVGKTYALAGAAYAWAISHPKSFILIISTGEDHSVEILDRVREFFRISKLGFDPEKDFVRNSQAEIRLMENGSRIVSRPSNPRTVRGYSPDLLLIDEVAAIEHWDEMQASLFPSVSQTDGSIVLTSTYKGKNHFWELTNKAIWNAKTYPWWVNPHPQIQELREILPIEQFSEEYECIPIDEAWSLFPLEMIEACSVDNLEEWFC